MFIWDFLFALVIAVILTAVFAAGFKRTGPWQGIWAFFFIILLASWAGGVWIRPFGPPLFGVFWFPFLITGILFAIILAAAVPESKEEKEMKSAGDLPKEPQEEQIAENRAAAALGIFFWIILIFLVFSVIAGYITPDDYPYDPIHEPHHKEMMHHE